MYELVWKCLDLNNSPFVADIGHLERKVRTQDGGLPVTIILLKILGAADIGAV